MVIEPRRSSWQATASGPASVKGKAPVSAGSLLGLVWKVTLLAGLAIGGWFAWQHAPAIWSSIRLNSDVESASVFFVRQLPRSVATEADLKRIVTVSAEDKLKTHLAYKARWYVAYGPRPEEMKVVRDDDFKTADKAFITQSLEKAWRNSELAGSELQTLSFPRGALARSVAVGDATWYVIAGWTEDTK